jgi:hypothetical protein
VEGSLAFLEALRDAWAAAAGRPGAAAAAAGGGMRAVQEDLALGSVRVIGRWVF